MLGRISNIVLIYLADGELLSIFLQFVGVFLDDKVSFHLSSSYPQCWFWRLWVFVVVVVWNVNHEFAFSLVYFLSQNKGEQTAEQNRITTSIELNSYSSLLRQKNSFKKLGNSNSRPLFEMVQKVGPRDVIMLSKVRHSSLVVGFKLKSKSLIEGLGHGAWDTVTCHRKGLTTPADHRGTSMWLTKFSLTSTQWAHHREEPGRHYVECLRTLKDSLEKVSSHHCLLSSALETAKFRCKWLLYLHQEVHGEDWTWSKWVEAIVFPYSQ